MNILVTGGSGFLGSHVADALSDAGHDVTIMDTRPSPWLRDDQSMVVGDILDRGFIDEHVQGKDVVYHFAGIAGIADAKNDPVSTVQVNVLGTTYLLDACVQHGVKRFMFASTVYVYGNHGSFYRGSKQACELLIECYAEARDISFTILRFGSLFGPRANHFNSVASMIESAIQDGAIVRVGDGNEVREYINVLDAARGSVRVLDDEFQNEYVMLTGSNRMTIAEVTSLIREIVGKEVNITFTGEVPEEHYRETPYTFRPRVAKKLVLDYHHEFGQSILDYVYSVHDGHKMGTAE